MPSLPPSARPHARPASRRALAALAAALAAAAVSGSARADEPLPAGPPAAAPPPIAPAPGPTVRAATGSVVVLEADDTRATLERRTGTQGPSGLPLLETGLFTLGTWEHACVTPCTTALDPRYVYRVAGDGLVPTGSFALPRTGDRVRVDARMGSSSARVTGALVGGGGVLAVGAGALALLATPVLRSEDVGSEGFRTGVLAGGVGALSVGVVAVAVGTLLWFTSGSTAHARAEVAAR
jgi:hypothetical protein